MRPASVLLSAISVLLSAILLSCISAHAYSGEPGDIATPSTPVPNMDMPKPLITKPNMDMPDPTPKPLSSLNKPNDNKLNDNISIPNQTGNTSSNQTQETQIEQKAEPINASGKWSIRFDDSTDRSLGLTLWSSTGATRIMGFGTLTEKGIANAVTASGSVTEQELRLTTKLATPEYSNLNYDECNLDLFKKNNTLSGTYVLRSGGQFIGEGNVTAVRQSPA